MGNEELLHTIGVVTRRTGLKADLVRAWERRYGAVAPQRTETDRRLYSESDIRRLMLLRDATLHGHKIGRIASLDEKELEALLEPYRRPVARILPDSSAPDVEPLLEALLARIEQLDAQGLSMALERASLDYGRIALVERVLSPLMQRVGSRWAHGMLDPSQEHLASAAVRSFVSGYLSQRAPEGAPAIVVTTPAGQLHELGAILAAAMAAAEGWHVVYLGADLPAASIAAAVELSGAIAVALGITFSDATPAVMNEVEVLQGLVSPVPVMVGGRGSEALAPLIERAGVRRTTSLADFRAQLNELESSTGAP